MQLYLDCRHIHLVVILSALLRESLQRPSLPTVKSGLFIGLCRRRHWPDPLYESYETSSGYTCTVRVNNREYQTDAIYESDSLARENAAMRAYMICLNFSANDGMYPVGHKHGGMMQGLPVAIGTGRHSTYTDDGSSGSRSGGSSPGSYKSGSSTNDGRRSKAIARALVYGSR